MNVDYLKDRTAEINFNVSAAKIALAHAEDATDDAQMLSYLSSIRAALVRIESSGRDILDVITAEK